ncbi:hypothetical protein GXM_03032 [Nostoc sphaeroides CCNUC1]|uniref:Uncharacterized protein n=1 Tax=Nostoc sphaeroides CCNUC1 TaxID=2653204 RepID=A0A5P8VYQ7_9NOSO|nr:hypothetical protein GXM_03032 [Nostoc sphaeroides CCNUC1]
MYLTELHTAIVISHLSGEKNFLFAPMPNAQYFSTRGCANGNAQYKCHSPHDQ